MTFPRRRFLATSLSASGLLALPHRGALSAVQGPRGGASEPLHPPVIKGFPHILHGGDWNPEQWRHEPKILEDDFRLMEKAGCNTFSVGIFAWSSLEPEEGRFDSRDEAEDDGYCRQLPRPSG